MCYTIFMNVIFDLDGTLLDTEKLYRRFWPMAARDFGYELSDEQALKLRSLGRPYAPIHFKEWFGEEFDYKKVRERRKEYVSEHIAKHGIELRPGVIETLDYLTDKDITIAIATATDLERTTKYLDMVGIRKYFKNIICATMVEHGKPSPEVYQYACKQLDATPSDCIAVEDAPNGVKSAYAAGLKVVFIPDQSPSDSEIKPMIYKELKILTELKDIV